MNKQDLSVLLEELKRLRNYADNLIVKMDKYLEV